MFFKSLFMRFSFVKKWMQRRTRNTLAQLHEKVEAQGFLEKDDITTLHSIVKTPVISFNEELVLGTSTAISFFTNTSVRALRALDKKEVVSINLAKSNDISLTPRSRRFDEWYSNQESVEEFIRAMSLKLEQQVIYYGNYARMDFEPILMLTEEDDDLFESQLYRILLLDLIGILWFYMDHQSD